MIHKRAQSVLHILSFIPATRIPSKMNVSLFQYLTITQAGGEPELRAEMFFHAVPIP